MGETGSGQGRESLCECRPLTTIRIQESNLGWFVYDYENFRTLAEGLTKD